MASIRKEITIGARPDDAWAALRDFGALHSRLVRGFATDTRIDGQDRVVTFFNGAVARERHVDTDDDARRLVWSIVDGPFTHHNASAQVFAAGEAGTLFVWIADLLPDEAAERTAEMMERGINAVKHTLENPES
jgi:Polyketide cyclase / dehydrase and lipid transport